jgi:gamma-glutamyltranspeptidase/glutathione hydrolase
MDFDYTQPYGSTRVPVFARNVVATSHPWAAQAGLSMLQRGGNAVDAAIATAAVMTLLEPCSNGLGSDAFCILWDWTRLHGLNASGPAPAAWTPDYFRRHGDAAAPPRRGWDSVTVPGAVAAWVVMSERFGRLPFADLLAPAIDIAERGSPVPVVVQHKWALAAQVRDLTSQPGFEQVFLPHGRAPRVGERFVIAGAAAALRAIAKTRGEAYYRGEIAQAIERHAREHGGALTAADMAAYRPEWVDPIAIDYRNGYRLHEIPPNGQGIAALTALGILRHFDIETLDPDGPESQHLQIEAMKLGFADAYRYVADPRTMEVTPEQMLDDVYLAERARLIDPKRAQDFHAGRPAGGTIYLSAVDERGMMVSFIQSNYMGFGSGVVVPEFGISLQNRGHNFSLDPKSPNVVAPGKRPFHTIIPGFVTRDGEPVMSFGVMGGNMQPQGHLQTLVRMIDHRQNPQAACDAPRWRYDAGLTINAEGSMPAATVQGLLDRGHQIVQLRDSYQDFGAGQFIWRLGDPAVDGYVAASDPRRDGIAAGW